MNEDVTILMIIIMTMIGALAYVCLQCSLIWDMSSLRRKMRDLQRYVLRQDELWLLTLERVDKEMAGSVRKIFAELKAEDEKD